MTETYQEFATRQRDERNAFVKKDLQGRLDAIEPCPICGQAPTVETSERARTNNYGIVKVTCSGRSGHSVSATDYGNDNGSHADAIWNGDHKETSDDAE